MTALKIKDQNYRDSLPEILSSEYANDNLIYFDFGESEREQLVIQKLGANGWSRLQLFKMHYSGSWGSGSEKPFSPKSYEALMSFLKEIDFSQNVRPSIFLSDEGNLALLWEDNEEQEIQVEFGPRNSEYYIEALEEERTVENDDLAGLAQLLKSHG